MAVGPCFRGKAHVAFLPDGRRMRLLQEYAFIDAAQLDWPVKKGAVIDGASIPQVLWSFLKGPYEGRYRNASIIHDWYCHIRTRSAHAVHRMFYEAMLTSRVSAARARIMYLAVRYAGPRWSDMVTMNARIAFGSSAAAVGEWITGTDDIPGFGREYGFRTGKQGLAPPDLQFGLPGGVSPWVVRRVRPELLYTRQGRRRRGYGAAGQGYGRSWGSIPLAAPSGIAGSLEGLAGSTFGSAAEWPAFEFFVGEGEDFACDYVERPGFGGDWAQEFTRGLLEKQALNVDVEADEPVLVTLDNETDEGFCVVWSEEEGFSPIQPISKALNPRDAMDLTYGKQLVWQRENVDEDEFKRLADIVERRPMTPDEIDQLVREEAQQA